MAMRKKQSFALWLAYPQHEGNHYGCLLIKDLTASKCPNLQFECAVGRVVKGVSDKLVGMPRQSFRPELFGGAKTYGAKSAFDPHSRASAVAEPGFQCRLARFPWAKPLIAEFFPRKFVEGEIIQRKCLTDLKNLRVANYFTLAWPGSENIWKNQRLDRYFRNSSLLRLI